MSAKVTFKRPSLEMEIEVGSLKELAGYITDEGSTLAKVFGSDMSLVVKSLSETTDVPEAAAEAPATPAPAPATEEKKKPGRPKKDKTPDPATASAPAPVEIPAPAPAPEAPHAPEVDPPAPAPVKADDGIPDFLKNQKEEPAPTLAPPAPPAPPPAPVAPPTGILAGKIIAATDKYREAGKEDVILNWLIGTGNVQTGATYDEAVSVIRLMPDAKLGAIATALSVAA